MKESKKRYKYLDYATELKKELNMMMKVIPVIIGALCTISKCLVKGLEDFKIGDVPDFSIIKSGKDTKKSPGDLKRLAVVQTRLKIRQQTLVWKTLKGV